MADDTDTQAGGSAVDQQDDAAVDDAAQDTGADKEKLLAALRSERAKLREAEKRLKQADDAKKSELERATERATAAEARIASLERSVVRARVAAKHEIPAELVDRIQGDDEAEMEKDAKALAKLIRPDGNLGGRQGGASGGPPSDDMNTRLRIAAGRQPVG